MATFIELSKMFLDGATEGRSAGEGNLKIKGDLLIHYRTPIVERDWEKYILNMTRYSIVTGRLQKQLMELIPEDKIIIVTGVPEGCTESLRNFIVQTD